MMEPSRSPQTTLNDLLDRILDKGILLNTDLIVTVAGIPLIGINLKLALAGMETMLEYGIMKDWDEAQRAVAMKETEVRKPSLGKDEYIIFSVFGTHWYSKGIYNNWRAGTIYITNKRLIMFRRLPFEILLEIYYEEIRAAALQEKEHFVGGKREELCLLLKEDELIRLHTKDVRILKKTVEEIIGTKGLKMEDNPVLPVENKLPGDFLQPEEMVTHSGKMWYRMPYVSDGTTHYQWKPGHLYLTNKRLCWWYDFEQKLLFEIDTGRMVHVTVQEVQFGNAPVQEKSLILLYRKEDETQAVCFSDSEASLNEWEKVIGELIEENESERSMEICPICGRKARRENLLENGCSRCGWVSHRRK